MATESGPRVYLDADVYLQVLKNESHAEECLAVLEAAERGDIRLLASRLVAVEVGSYRGDRPGETVAERFIEQYLDGVSAEWSELDILVAREARELSWKYKLRGGDAVHLATAVRRRADYFMSIDHAFPFGRSVAGVQVMKPGVVWEATLFSQSSFQASDGK